MYWLDALQQTSTSRRQKFDLFYPKCSPQVNKPSLTFKERKEVAKKWLKLKQSRKPHICGIRRLRVKKYIFTDINIWREKKILQSYPEGIESKLVFEKSGKFWRDKLLNIYFIDLQKLH